MRGMPIYLDVCSLSRPFDDQTFLRIRLEIEAVNLIMSKVLEGYLTLAVSPVRFTEINAIPDTLERLELLSIVERYYDIKVWYGNPVLFCTEEDLR